MHPHPSRAVLWDTASSPEATESLPMELDALGDEGYLLRQVQVEGRDVLLVAARQDIGVLDADVLQTYIDTQAKDAVSGLPVLNLLPVSLYSTKSYSE